MERINKFDVINIKKKAAEFNKRYENMRYGQSIFNAAYEMFPEATDELRGTKFDPFYDDKKVESFLTELINC